MRTLLTFLDLKKRILDLKASVIMRKGVWEPSKYTIFITFEDWRNIVVDPDILELGPAWAWHLIEKKELYGVRIVPVSRTMIKDYVNTSDF